MVRLAEEYGQLRIFIPREDTDLREIYSTYLPKEMMMFLKINGANSLEAITGILHAEIPRLEITLNRRGIFYPGTNSALDVLPIDDEPAAINETNSQVDTVLGVTAPARNWIDQGIYGLSELPQGAFNGLVSQDLHIASIVDRNNVTVSTNWATPQFARRAGPMLEENEIGSSGIAFEATVEYRGGRPSLDEINNVVGNFEAQRQAVIEHARSSNIAAFNLVASSNINTSLAPMSNGTALAILPQLDPSFDTSAIVSVLPATAPTEANENTTSQVQVGQGDSILKEKSLIRLQGPLLEADDSM